MNKATFILIALVACTVSWRGRKRFCRSRPEVCPAVYKPVCGHFNPEIVQCITWPCAQTYSNSCEACADDKVLTWTSGPCKDRRRKPSQNDGLNMDNYYQEGGYEQETVTPLTQESGVQQDYQPKQSRSKSKNLIEQTDQFY